MDLCIDGVDDTVCQWLVKDDASTVDGVAILVRNNLDGPALIKINKAAENCAYERMGSLRGWFLPVVECNIPRKAELHEKKSW